jgi:HK97 family phage portal protein
MRSVDFEVTDRGAVRIQERDYDHNALAQMWLAGTDGAATKSIPKEEAMRRKSWVFAAVTAIARTGSSIPMRIRTTNGRPVTRGPAVELFRRPSPRKTFKDLIYSTFQHLETAGNSYWHMQFSQGSNKPISLLPLSPQRTRPIIVDEQLMGYSYRQLLGNPAQGSLKFKDVVIPAGEVIQFMYPNPNSQWHGLAPLEACMDAVNTDIKAASYNMAFFDNAAQPGGLLIHKRAISKQQQEQVKLAFQQDHGGPDRAHKTAVLAGDWDYKQLGLSQRDMDFLDQRRFSREEIGAVFGVPAVLMNDPANSNYSTASVELRIFAESNWLPKLMMIEEIINTQLFMYYWPEMALSFDTKEAPGLREDMGQKVDRAEKLFKMGIPLNDIITLLDLPIASKEWGNEWWLPSSMKSVLEEPADNTPPEQLPQPDKEKPLPPAKDPAEIKAVVGDFAKRLQGYLTSLRSECVSAEHRGDPLPFDLASANERMAQAVLKVSRIAYNVGRGLEGCGSTDAPAIPDTGILSLPAVIHETLAPQQGRDRAIRFVFDELRSRAKMLSSAQVGAAVHLGRLSAMVEQGHTHHRWVSATTGNGLCCSQNNDLEVEIGSPFGDGCAYPLDPVGSQNPLCRCTTVPA